MSKPRDHLLLPDPQLRHNVPNDHIAAAARLANDREPAVIVFGGDWWDFPSLSRYASTVKLVQDEACLHADMMAGIAAMKLFMDALTYTPETIVFVEGNHENRVNIFRTENPVMRKLLPSIKKVVTDLGIKFYPFLEPVTLGGVKYCHYFQQPKSGSAIGTAQALMTKHCCSCTAFHQQGIQYKINELNPNIRTLITGSFYLHDEEYMAHNNTHWRGLVYKHGVINGGYDLEEWSVNKLLENYGE